MSEFRLVQVIEIQAFEIFPVGIFRRQDKLVYVNVNDFDTQFFFCCIVVYIAGYQPVRRFSDNADLHSLQYPSHVIFPYMVLASHRIAGLKFPDDFLCASMYDFSRISVAVQV